MSTPISDLNDVNEAGAYTFHAPSKPIEPRPSPPGIRYYKVTGQRRIKGAWLVVRIGDRGLANWEYLAPMTIGKINYPKEKL